eukprot:s1553_g15.t2
MNRMAVLSGGLARLRRPRLTGIAFAEARLGPSPRFREDGGLPSYIEPRIDSPRHQARSCKHPASLSDAAL